MTNWAGNLHYQAQNVLRPRSLAEVQEVVRKASRLKVVGTRHSFNTIADTTADHLSPEHLNRVVALDPEAQTVTLEAGVRYGDLAEYLHQRGFALHNLASLPHISVAGACATATHGSGEKNGNLATAVRALEIITASGDVVTFSRDDEAFAGAVVGLGALGVVIRITLQIEPTYAMRQVVYCDLPFSRMDAHFDAIQSSAYSVSLFTDWRGDTINQVWLKQRVEEDALTTPEFFGARAADDHLHPIPGVSAIHCTEQLGMVGAWHERLPHFKMNFTPSSGDELQSEYFVPREAARAALQSIRAVQDAIAPLLLTSEIRSIAADDLWMSPCYQQDSVAIHFTWKPLWEDVRRVLPQIEQALQPMNGRPHWGKLFTMDAPGARYTKLDDFRGLVEAYDPGRKFSNLFLEQYIYP